MEENYSCWKYKSKVRKTFGQTMNWALDSCLKQNGNQHCGQLGHKYCWTDKDQSRFTGNINQHIWNKVAYLMKKMT